VTHFLVPSIPNTDLFYYLNRNLVLLSRKYAPGSLLRLALKMLFYDTSKRLVYAMLDLLLLRPSASSRLMRSAVSSMRGTIDGLSARQNT
jgi:hypothetical protein